MLSQLPSDGASLLGPQIQWQQLLLLVSLPQSRLLLLRYHRQHLSDPEPHNLAAIKFNIIQTEISTQKNSKIQKNAVELVILHLGELVGGAAGDFGDAEEGELRLEILELAQEIGLGLPPQLMDLDSC